MSSSAKAVFEAQTTEDLAARYDEWSGSYEQDMDVHRGPREAAEALARRLPPGARILDTACGTGLSGETFVELGFRNLEGLDLSAGMLEIAARKGCYRKLHQAALGGKLPFATATFDGVMAVGVFVRGHAPASSLVDMVRITKPGGYVVFTIRPEFYEISDFKPTIAELTESRKWRFVDQSKPFDALYKEFPGINMQVWTFEVLGVSEGDPVPEEWNETVVPYPTNRLVHQLVEEQVEKSPAATAVVYEETKLTYVELNQRANQLAHHLIKLGAGPDTLVGLCVHRTLDLAIGMLGILKSGAAYVPIDPAYPKARQAFMIEDAAMPILVTHDDLADDVGTTGATLVRMDRDWPLISTHSTANPDVLAHPKNLAYVLYTSGSTGRPKGVQIEHHSVVVFLSWALSTFTPEELSGTFASSSVCFDHSVFEIFTPLCCGSSTIIGENALALPTLPARKDVTFLLMVPPAMNALLALSDLPASVLVVNLAGEALSNKLAQQIYRTPTIRSVNNMYGPSEDTTHSTWTPVRRDALKNPPIGRPLPNTKAYIVDENMTAMQVGTPGELCVAGEGLARGYLNRPELTTSRFVQNPFGPGRLYRTGDLARWLPDGTIEFLGRLDFQVKIRGFRIELGEIETTLERHPAVDQATVLALPGPDETLQLISYLTVNQAEMKALAGTPDKKEHISLWQDLYENVYRQADVAQDVMLNTAGWQSSYTDQPIPDEEMKDWVDQTVERILSLKPKRVLELGCGTGMLLARVAPFCDSYTGLDISATALDHIRKMQGTLEGLGSSKLFVRGADETADFASQSFDTVVINSVMQHFPDIDYLLRVLDEAMRLLSPGGHIFLGDVIAYPLLESFHTSVQLFRAQESDAIGVLKRRVRDRLTRERDLTLTPAIFVALAESSGKPGHGISHLEVLLKRGRYMNQLTRFRYDVILTIGGASPAFKPVSWLGWQREKLSLAGLRSMIEATTPEVVGLRSIPNVRVDGEAATSSWLRTAKESDTVNDLAAYLLTLPANGIEPDVLAAIAEELGYRIEMSWMNCDVDGAFDAVLTRKDQPVMPASFVVSAPPSIREKTQPGYAAFANHPQRDKVNQKLISELRDFVTVSLPRYMVPAAIAILDKMPLSPNGKIDRASLARLPVTFEVEVDETSTGALTPLQQLLAQAWSETLHLRRVGLNGNFFELGGDSLRAVALTHQLQKALGVDVPPAAILGAPTVSLFADYLERVQPGIGTRLGQPSAPTSDLSITATSEAAHTTQYYPTSFAQSRFWSLQQEHAEVPFYNEPFTFRLNGPVDMEVLRRSFDAVVNRHESLRTTLQIRDAELVQVIAPSGSMKLRQVSVRASDPATRQAEIDALLRAEMLEPFDHASEIGLRAFFVKVGQDQHILQFTLHNTLFDAASLTILLDEVSQHYAAFIAGGEVELPVPTQYREYVKWQAAFPKSGHAGREAYWKNWFLHGDPPALNWRGQVNATAEPMFETYAPRPQVSAELSEQLRELSRRGGVTLYITLMATYAIFLRHCRDCSDITFGTTYSNRNRWDFSTLVGALINVPALRIEVADGLSFWGLLEKMRDVLADALNHQDVPFDVILPHLQLDRKPSSGPLFRAMFSFLPEMPHERLNLPGVSVEFLEDLINEISRPELYLVLWESPAAADKVLRGYWLFRKNVFEAEAAVKLNDDWLSILTAVTREPATPIEALLARLSWPVSGTMDT